VIGEIKHKRGDIPGAVKLYRQSLRLAHDMGIAQGIIEALVAIATAYRDWLLPTVATRLLAAMDAYRRASDVGTHVGPAEVEQQLIDDLQATLGFPEFAVAWEGGESMAIESALTLALTWSLPTRATVSSKPLSSLASTSG
jgi:hypothetical protein